MSVGIGITFLAQIARFTNCLSGEWERPWGRQSPPRSGGDCHGEAREREAGLVHGSRGYTLASHLCFRQRTQAGCGFALLPIALCRTAYLREE
jgi:hypothetical protein